MKKNSKAVTHPSTDQTQCCLTSVIGRGRSADWAIQGPSEACKKLLYINIGIFGIYTRSMFATSHAWRYNVHMYYVLSARFLFVILALLFKIGKRKNSLYFLFVILANLLLFLLLLQRVCKNFLLQLNKYQTDL